MKILFIGNSMEGTLKQRVLLPCKYLDNADYTPEINVMTMQCIVEINILGKWQLAIKDMTSYDVVCLQYAWDNDLVLLISKLNRLGIKVVIDTDDDYFNQNKFYPIDYSNNRMDNFVKSLSMADLVTTTTESLAETYSKYNDNIKILPNCIDLSEFDIEHKPYGKTVGWYGGAVRFEEMRSILEGWIPEGVNLFLAGSLDFKKFKYDNLIVADRFEPDYLPHILANIDIGLIPLSLCKFNDGKSDLKGLEYGALRIPAIISPTEPYRKLINHGENGLLVKHGRDWLKYIELLINDSKL